MKTIDDQLRGLLIVHTGNGKGKSTAAAGIVLRMLSHNRQVAVLQFIKSSPSPAEYRLIKDHPCLVYFRALGAGGSWRSKDPSIDRKLARDLWLEAQTLLSCSNCHLVVLDEINIAIHRGFLSVTEIKEALLKRRSGMHVLLTGRNADPQLCEISDLITDFHMHKHPFVSERLPAQAGLEF